MIPKFPFKFSVSILNVLSTTKPMALQEWLVRCGFGSHYQEFNKYYDFLLSEGLIEEIELGKVIRIDKNGA